MSSLLVIKELNGKLRVCIDPKPLNKALKHSHYPLPVIDDLLPDLSKAKVFSVCDIKMGFGTWNWMKLRATLQPLTLLLGGTAGSNYHLASPLRRNTFCQHWLDQTIEGLPGVGTVADDILITGEGDTLQDAVKDHDKKLLALLTRCRDKGVKLNKEKFKLRMTEVPYVSHVLTKDSLKPDPSKIEAIQKMS